MIPIFNALNTHKIISMLNHQPFANSKMLILKMSVIFQSRRNKLFSCFEKHHSMNWEKLTCLPKHMWSHFIDIRHPCSFGYSSFLMERSIEKNNHYIKVICKVKRLGGENSQFWHNIGNESFTHNEITGTQTSFSTNFGDELSFILSFLFLERLHCY